MEDKVGSHVPSVREVEALVTAVNEVLERIKPWTVELTSEQRVAVTKFRPGGETVVAKVGSLATEHGLALPGISPEGMSADLLLAQRLAPLAGAVAKLHQRVDDTILEAHSESWWACTAFYTALSRMTGNNPTLHNALKDVIAFFAAGRRKKNPEGEK